MMIIDNLLLFGILFVHVVQGSKSCMSGFPERNRLVSDLFSRTGPATRLIPEMRFVCNGTIVGYTVAIRKMKKAQHPMIQIWRKNDSDYQPNIYHQAGAGIPITDTRCVHGLVEVRNLVFHCDLTGDAQLSVQPGDILALVLPPSNNDSSVLLFAQVGKGPISYVFEQQVLSLSTVAVLSDGNISTVVNEVPQINVVVESGSDYTIGFPNQDMLTSGILDEDGYSNTTVTILIPDMNFTCSGTLAGFTFAGSNRQRGDQDPVIQIWRKNISEPGVYYKTGPEIAVNISKKVCADGLIRVASRTWWCILNKPFQLSIWPGDILGLELPPAYNNDYDILFTRGTGPKNYVFRQPLNSTVELSDGHSENYQLPQIIFSLTSDQCTSGFPDVISRSGNNMKYNEVTTKLFPNMTFGCTGKIVRIEVASSRNRNKQQSAPKIQIWRENLTQPGVYHKISRDIPIVKNNSVCTRNRYVGGIFRCALNETFQVSVQPGDILGLELPPSNDIYFTAGGPVNYLFEGHLNSIIDISKVRQSNDLPQISLLVTLDEEQVQMLPSCTIPPTLDTKQSHSSTMTVALSVTAGCTIAIVCFIFIGVASVVKYKRKQRSHMENLDTSSHAHPVYQKGDVSEAILMQSSASANHTVVNNTIVPTEIKNEPEYYELAGDYDEIADSKEDRADVNPFTEQYETSQLSSAIAPHADCHVHSSDIAQHHTIEDEDHEYNHLEMDQTSGKKQTISVLSDADDDYWEPADNVNELYKQLCSRKYREIMREQVQ